MANIQKFTGTEAKRVLDELQALVNCMLEYTPEELGWTDEDIDSVWDHAMTRDFDLMP